MRGRIVGLWTGIGKHRSPGRGADSDERDHQRYLILSNESSLLIENNVQFQNTFSEDAQNLLSDRSSENTKDKPACSLLLCEC